MTAHNGRLRFSAVKSIYPICTQLKDTTGNVICCSAHPSISCCGCKLQPITVPNGLLTLSHLSSLPIFLLWKERCYILLAFLFFPSVSLAFVCHSGRKRRRQFTVANHLLLRHKSNIKYDSPFALSVASLIVHFATVFLYVSPFKGTFFVGRPTAMN